MMNKKLLLALISLLWLCPILSQVTVTADESISVSPQEISAFREKIVNRENRNIEVMIYSLSTNREVFYLDENGELQVSVESGYIRCMVTEPDNNNTTGDKAVFFVESSGNNRESLFRDAAQKITQHLKETSE